MNTVDRHETTGNSSKAKLFGFALCALLFALWIPVEAQQPNRIPRIGVLWSLSPSSVAPYNEAFRLGLRDLGYVEGKNVFIEHRYVEGRTTEPLVNVAAEHAAELVRLKVDVIVTSPAPPAIYAAQRATRAIPIVMGGAIVDPVEAGFVANLARPGGNITGLTNLQIETHAKRLELLKEASPRISRVAVFWSGSQEKQGLKQVQAAGQALGIQILSVVNREGRGVGDLESALSAISRGRSDALLTATSGFTLDYRARIIDFAAKNRMPSMYERRRFVTDGGLMFYGTDMSYLYRRTAVYVDRILKGAKPADLPVEQPTKFELIINLKTAKQIGLTIPPNVLARADRVIR
jgi:putative ABC transport system substrate-binding protein